MTQIVQVSTLYQLANIAATIDAGLLGAPDERRILVVANNSYAPEITPSATQMPGSQTLLSRFERVIDWNATIWPNHPKTFGVAPSKAPILRRLLGLEWELAPDEDISLVVESLPGHPAHCLTQIFHDSMISVHADGLMSYGPIRNPLGRPVWQRLETVHYTDLLPGVTPRQMAEHDPRRVALPIADLATVIDEMAVEVGPALAEAGLNEPLDSSAVILGQYLAQIHLISEEEELKLHLQMVDEVASKGLSTVVFKPHPTSARTMIEPLRDRSRELGLRFILAEVPVLAEILIARLKPSLVVSCFSTGMITSQAMFDVEIAAVGTDLLLKRLAPYQNSNRIPLTIIDALCRSGYSLPADAAAQSSGAGAPGTAAKGRDVNTLIDAVTYCMQPTIMVDLRDPAVEFLESALGSKDMKYFKRKRLTRLNLPGSVEQTPTRKVLSTVKRTLRSRAKSTQVTLNKYGITIDTSKVLKRG